MKSIIQFREVSKAYSTKYQRIDVLDSFNMEIERGEFAVIIGPSGSGKSTILNLIAGFIRPDSGGIFVNGQDISKFNEFEICRYRIQQIGFVFQFFNLIHSLNAEDNIQVPMLLEGVEKNKRQKRVNDLLGKIGIAHRKKHYPWEMSGGEQQRVAIARALVNSPNIILADEPTGNLDKKTSESILDVLTKINKEGKTVVVITHDTKVVNRATKVYDIESLLG